MANGVYDRAREDYLGGDLDWDANDVRLLLIDHGVDTPSLSADITLTDRAAGARVAASGAFASKTKVAGVADAADVTLTAVTGASCESIDIYKFTGTDSTSNLIANIDTATGLPVTPNGGDITIAWDNGANKIFKL